MEMKKVTITENQILIEGFGETEFVEPGKSGLDLGSCRDVARVGMAWALRKLAEDVEKDMTGDWDRQISCIGD
jgi:hypothetical protein